MLKKLVLSVSLLVVASVIVGCASTPSTPTAAPVAPTAAPVLTSAAAPTAAPAAPTAATAPTAASSVPTAAAAPKNASPIRVGFLAMRSGPMGQQGEDLAKGAQLALSEINNQVAGRQLVVTYEDDKTEAATGIAKAKKLVESDRIQVLLGPMFGAVMQATRDYLDSKGVPTLMWAGMVDFTREKKSKYIFNVHTTPETAYAGVMAKYLVDNGYKKLTTVAEDIIIGQLTSGAVKKIFEAGGGKIVEAIYNPLGTADFAPYMAKIDPKANDVVWAWQTGVDTNRFLSLYSQYGLKDKIQLTGNVNLIDSPTAALGEPATKGVLTSSWWDPGLNTPANNAFTKAFIAKYNEPPNINMAIAYQTVKVLVAALNKIDGNIEDTAAFLKALEQTNIEGPAGPLRFDENHGPVQNAYVFKCCYVKDGIRGGEVVATYKDVDQWFTERVTGEKK